MLKLKHFLLSPIIIFISFSVTSAESTIGKNANFSTMGKTRTEIGVNVNNIFFPGMNRYSFKNMEEFITAKTIDGFVESPYQFEKIDDLPKLETIKIEYHNSVTGNRLKSNVAQMLFDTNTDAFIVLKNGKIAYEQYFDGQNSRTRHQLNSVTKSLVGLISRMLIEEGKLEKSAKIISYIPELKNSAYENATVSEVLDMTVNVKYSEQYDDPNSEIAQYMTVLGLIKSDKNTEPFETLREFLISLKSKGENGKIFQYVTPNADILCWLNEKVTGKSFDRLLSEKIWSKINVDRDAYVLVDSSGIPICGGGLNATAIDLAKIGQLLLNNGKFGEQQIIPGHIFDEIKKGGNQNAFSLSEHGNGFMKGWSYKDQFWVRHNQNNAYTAIGIYGQWVYIDPKANIVIVKQSSLPDAENPEVDDYILAGFDAVINSLK